MIEDCAQPWTEQEAKWLNSVMNTKMGQRVFAHLRHWARARPLNIPLQPGLDLVEPNALANRDLESANKTIDHMIEMCNVQPKKEPIPTGVRQLIRDPDKEPTIQPRKRK